jgi:hypothetical protein
MYSKGRLLCSLAAALLAGCSDRVERVRVSGQITFQGKPVPYGNITFEPDRTKGNQGPQGYAQIRDGQYDTRNAGTEPCPGAQNVHIIGYPELGSGATGKTMLVIDYYTTAELTRQAATKDFDVPASGARQEAVIQQLPP